MIFVEKKIWVDEDGYDGCAWGRMHEWDGDGDGHGHGKQILKGNQKKLASLWHQSPPPAQDMVSATWFHTQGKIKGTIADLTVSLQGIFVAPTNTPFSLSTSLSSFAFILLSTFTTISSFSLSSFYNTYI